MREKNVKPFAVALLLLSLPALARAHGKEIELGGGGGPVTLTTEQQAAIGLKTVKAGTHDIDTVIELRGLVKLDPYLHAHVASRILGRVEKLYVKVGDRVVKGQKLAEIQSFQIGNPPPTVAIESIVTGMVDERAITVGQSVDPGKDLFHIVDLSQVFVQAEAYEEDVAKIKIGQTARIHVLGYPDEAFDGTVTYVGLQLDPEKRTLPIWIAAKNPDWKMRPEMFAKATVLLAKSEGVLAVPREAILEEGGEKLVFIATGDSFDSKDVATGVQDDRFVEITDGLVPDDVVVTDGKRQVYTSWLTGGTKAKAAGTDKGKDEHGSD